VINGNAKLLGNIISDQLVLNANAVLAEVPLR
jgi:hypothetical protein